ncbi:hypothetical protein AMAG_10108 [Allomyces macrogynus ATCC 38327]|uniref:Uncharacterized protein n=1 Tax=Allomyces macrogynus (strain ATCC 38327) TaxID=578462 RepID=A0A0L0SQX6_ALLM3|nr:hypothetical protein AMAG_10108 [Allomyces macrogynus ATCC 38327]|eukprot:KNE64760.1 hypothetical protein AMAG_10108 [Allomyces macrogynus ATCC 38327]
MTSSRASTKKSSIIALLALVALLLVSTPTTSATAIASRDVQLFKRRFGQENPTVLNDVRALGRLPGSPPDGRFDQIAGAFIGTLLAAADPCARYPLADEVVERGKMFGFADQAIKVARQLVGVEKNFNPFAGDKAHPAFCNDPALPKSEELRCILPQVDPVSGGNGGLSAAEFNAKAVATMTVQNANKCAGMSVRQQVLAAGFKDVVSNAGAAPTNPQQPPAATTTPTPEDPNKGGKNGGNKGNGNNDGQCTATATVTMTVTVTAGSGAAAPTEAPNAPSTGGSSGSNVQTFTGALFGKPAPPVNFVGGTRPFQVIVGGKLNGDFLQAGAALGRSCDVQHNQCANEVNSQRVKGSVGQCDQQNNECHAAIAQGQASAAKLQQGGK